MISWLFSGHIILIIISIELYHNWQWNLLNKFCYIHNSSAEYIWIPLLMFMLKLEPDIFLWGLIFNYLVVMCLSQTLKLLGFDPICKTLYIYIYLRILTLPDWTIYLVLSIFFNDEVWTTIEVQFSLFQKYFLLFKRTKQFLYIN